MGAVSNYLLSIVVPVFNTGEYLERCLNSLTNQSLKDIEIIIINDGSTDNSHQIIENYLTNENIKYFPLNQNNGLGYARNIGLKQARGNYITFVDSDDWVDLDLYKTMCTAINKDKTDIAICGVKNEWGNYKCATVRYKYMYPNIIDSIQALSLLSKSSNNNYFISAVVWKRNLIVENKLTFLDNSYWEDDIFSFKCLCVAKRITLVPDVYYHYYHRDNSITKTISKKHIDDFLCAFLTLKQNLIAMGAFNKVSSQYQAMLDKCFCFLVDMIINNESDNRTQKHYLVYLFKNFLSSFSVEDVVNYLSINRILRLFC